MGSLVKIPLSELMATLEVLERFGMTRDDLTRIRADEFYTEQITKVACADVWKGIETPSQKIAHEIMGKNFFGVQEAFKYFGVSPNCRQLAALSKIPFPTAVLKELKDTHILVAVFPLYLSDIHLRSEVSFNNSYGNSLDIESLTTGCDDSIWHLIRKTPVKHSVDEKKGYQQKVALLSKDEEIPHLQVMIYTIIGFYKATREYLFQDVYVITSTTYYGEPWIVGKFSFKGIRIDQKFGTNGIIGIASERKPSPSIGSGQTKS